MQNEFIDLTLPVVHIFEDAEVIAINALGSIEDTLCGFRLGISKELKPFMQSKDGEIVQAEDFDWSPYGAAFQKVDIYTQNFCSLLADLMSLEEPGEVEDTTVFSAILLHGDLSLIKNYNQEDNKIYPLTFGNEFKVEYGENEAESAQCFFILDLDKKELTFSEKDMDMRPNLLKAFFKKS